MGLHNKLPSYFYKRGNLFNTYLGHTDGPGASTTSKRQKKQTRSRSRANPATGGALPEPFDHALATELHAFTLKHLSESEANLLVERSAQDRFVTSGLATRFPYGDASTDLRLPATATAAAVPGRATPAVGGERAARPIAESRRRTFRRQAIVSAPASRQTHARRSPLRPLAQFPASCRARRVSGS